MDTQWSRVKDIFQQAMDRTPRDRLAFVVESCAGDDRLRNEVESLIKETEMSGDFMERPITLPQSIVQPQLRHIRNRPASLLGGRYQVSSFIGAGGVGDVYLAHDTQLDRRVAVKLLQ